MAGDLGRWATFETDAVAMWSSNCIGEALGLSKLKWGEALRGLFVQKDCRKNIKWKSRCDKLNDIMINWIANKIKLKWLQKLNFPLP